MGLGATKPVFEVSHKSETLASFEVSHKARLKPVSRFPTKRDSSQFRGFPQSETQASFEVSHKARLKPVSRFPTKRDSSQFRGFPQSETQASFEVSHKARLKPVSRFPTKRDSSQFPGFPQSETQASLRNYKDYLENCNFACSKLDMILSKRGIPKVLISLCRSTGWSVLLLFANPRKQVFMCQGRYVYIVTKFKNSSYFNFFNQTLLTIILLK